MAYPTDPSQVGLTVAKSMLDVVDTATSYRSTVPLLVENKLFVIRPLVNGIDGGLITFRNCWFVLGLSVTNSPVYVVEDFEMGYDGVDGAGLHASLTTGGSYDPDDFYYTTAAGPNWTLRRGYIHHMAEGPQIGDDCLMDFCYLSDVYGRTGDHADLLQCVGNRSGTIIRNSYLNGVSIAASQVECNRAIIIQDNGGAAECTITGNYIKGESFYSVESHPKAGIGVYTTMTYNDFADADLTPIYPVEQFASRYENRYLASRELIDGDQSDPNMSASLIEAGGAGADNTADWTLTLPAAAVTDDWLVACYVSRGSGDTLTLPSGWDLVTTEQWSTTSLVVTAKHKVTGAEAPGSTTYLFNNSNNFRDRVGVYALIRGADTTDCVAASADAADGSFNTSFEAPAVTTTEDAQLVLTFFHGAAESLTFSSPSPAMTQRAVVSATACTATAALYSYTKATAGSTGTHTVTSSGSGTSFGATIAIKDAPAAPTPSSGQSSMTRGGALRDDLATILY